MKFLILSTDYPEFLHWLYAQHPRLDERPYQEQMRMRVESLFGGPDNYSSNLRTLGHEAWDSYANNEFMQKRWAREHGIRLGPDWEWEFRLRRRIVPWVSRVPAQRWFHQILAAQIKHYEPDILLNHAMDGISSRFLKEMKPYVRLLVGQHAAPFPPGEDYGCYDLFISSLPNFVEQFRQKGIPAEFSRLGFEPRWLAAADAGERLFDLTFVGSLFNCHKSRVAMLEILCARIQQAKVWTPRIDHVPLGSPIRGCYAGPAWGREMYRILSCSKITLNDHGEFAPYANNSRLYEATGMGALLITDWKQNLHELFEPGKEVVAYHSPEECVELVQYYLEHEEEREAIALAGQQRTLREHTYDQRVRELVEIVCEYLH